MKIIIAPDKFKHSLTSFEVIDAIREGINQCCPTYKIQSFPLSDGGDGFAAAIHYYLATETITVDTVDPLYRSVQASYEWQSAKQTAFIEMAVASGIALLEKSERNPLHTSTKGTGLLIKDAVDRGAKKIVMGLGGSATNDAGLGILEALGFQFCNQHHQRVSPKGIDLPELRHIIAPASIPAIEFELAIDVDNPLYGEQGAAVIYGPQKGADDHAIKLLDKGLKHVSLMLQIQTKKKLDKVPGIGAAGGAGLGIHSFFETKLVSGIDYILNLSGIKDQLLTADLLITGEGRFDDQSVHGKVVGRMAQLAKEFKKPCIVCCGKKEISDELLQTLSIESVIQIEEGGITREEAMKNAKSLLTNRVKDYFSNRINSTAKD